ncbi:MAG: class I SAM-dependent methyltransferase [Henriciella sp.]|nr:class I SAM-dependent methyltransferase [Henriciella sp.]
MKFESDTFGKLYADEYDKLHNPGTTTASVNLIAELAGSSRLLELAIGTGRMALPLVEKGFELEGVEGSPDMVDKMRAKPGGADIPVLIADMADFEIGRSFEFAFLVFNTLFNLTSQAAQVQCFQSVARHLEPGGRFLVETFVPDLTRFDEYQALRTKHIGAGSVWLEAVEHDPVEQVFNFQRVRITDSGVRLAPLVMRYAWPQEIDLMAELAGLQLEARWGGWAREPFTADSKMHVSLYRKTED